MLKLSPWLACALLVGLGAAVRAGPMGAQEFTTESSRPLIASVSHWGRWVTLAAAGGLIAAAAVRHDQARDALTRLEEFCAPDALQCVIVDDPSGGGFYVNPEAEALYQQYAALERGARGFLLGGQVSLLTSGAMFLIDIIHRTEGVDNIPYTPLELYTTPRQLGLAFRF